MGSLPEDPLDPPVEINPAALRFIGLFLVGIVVLGFVAFLTLRPSASKPPIDIASDPFLLQGRTRFLDRCASCHGQTGKGDGPTAATLKGGRAGDLTDQIWKFGDKPDEVMGLISKGTPGGDMPGWGRVFEADDLRAVTGYVYYLAKQPVPESLRQPKAGRDG